MSDVNRVICFHGKKVNLGLLEKDSDMRRCLGWVNDPEVQRYLGSTLPIYPSTEEEWFDNFPKKENTSKLLQGTQQ